MSLSRTLLGTALGLALAGLALRLQPLHLPEAAPPSPLPVRARAQTASGMESASAYAAIPAANAFSAARTPPAKRFSPDGRTEERPPARRPAARKPAEPPARLYGITRGVNGTVALIEADPKVPGAELYRLGDRVGSARLAAISDSTVELQGSAGRVVLHLPRAQDQ